jgi:hypothetical protein
LSRGIVGLVLVGVLAAGVLYFGGWDALSGLLNQSEDAEKPAVVPTQPAEATPTVTPTASVTIPDEALEQMYFEQLASQELIGKLVAGDIVSLALSDVVNDGGSATIRVEATLKDSAVIGGNMQLRRFDEAWYFYMITRDPHDKTTPKTGTPDLALMRTIVEQQAVSQDIPTAMLGGQYTACRIGQVTPGAGTVEIEMTLAGAAAPDLKGSILCVSKGDTSKKWFITSFQRR